MKILELVSGRGVDGVATHCRELTRGLAKRGHDVTVLCRPGAWLATQLDLQLVAVEQSSMKRTYAELRRIAQWIRAEKFDVLHTHQSSAHFFGVLLRYMTGLPVVASAHATHIQPHFWFNDHVIAVSDATRNYHRRVNLVPNRRITVAHNFVDVDDFATARGADGAALKQTLGIPADASVLMAIGTVGPRKNQAALAPILARLAVDLADVRLVLIGDIEPAYQRIMDASIARHAVGHRVIFAGRRKDARQLLAAADLFVSTSRSECLPMAIIEAMAMARPVVAYNVGGIAELVEHGRTGFAVAKDDDGSFEKHVRQVLTDQALRRQLGRGALERVQQHFSTSSEIGRIEAVLTGVAERRHPPRNRPATAEPPALRNAG